MTKNTSSLYFVGIGGVGMASVAGLAQLAGFDVIGSDQNLYPPTSDILKDLKIPVLVPYSEKNVESNNNRLFVIGNAMSKQQLEVAKILGMGLSYTSFPKFLSDYFLGKTDNIVVCGTHGKTTTSSLISYLLEKLNAEPSYMIGGAPVDLPNAFSYGKGSLFVLEGDEYDTAFFDKGSKFLHYKPNFIVFNNLEYDHVDIFKDYNALKKTFHLLLDQIKNPENVISNFADPGVKEILNERGWTNKVFSTSILEKTENIYLNKPVEFLPKTKEWGAEFQTKLWGKLPVITQLPGSYNFANIAQALGALTRLVENNKIKSPLNKDLLQLIKDFHGVAKRWEILLSTPDLEILLDFAHHPTAVYNVIKNLRAVYKNRRLITAFEPKNATSRRNVFQSKYAEVFKEADLVFIAPPPQDLRIPENERMNIQQLCEAIGNKATAYDSFQTIEKDLLQTLAPGDVLIFLTPGDFGGLPRSVRSLALKNMPG